MIKMLFSSFYNTLIDEEEAIPTSTMLELDRVRGNGTFFCILTNRSIEEILYYNHDYPFIDYIIAFNGGIIYDVKKEQYLSRVFMKKEVLHKLNEEFSSFSCLYYTENGVSSSLPEEEVYKMEVSISKKDLKKIGSLDISYTVLEYQKNYSLEFSGGSFLEAIFWLLKKNEISLDEVIGVVGNESDLSIVEHIDNTFVVSNASRLLKKISRKKTKSNKNKGVEWVLKKYC